MLDSIVTSYKSTLFTFLMLLIPFTGLAQAKFEWAAKIGGSGGDVAYNIAVDEFGNVYTLGVFGDDLIFDDADFNLSTVGGTDVFVSKHNEAGVLLWIKSFGSEMDDEVSFIEVGQNDEIVIGGFFKETVDFDPGEDEFVMTSGGEFDSFVMKMSSDGDFIWAKQIKGDLINSNRDCFLSSEGDLYITGNYIGDTDFDTGPGEYILGGSDIYGNGYVLKLNTDGDFVWAISGDNSSADAILRPQAIDLDEDGNIYTTGFFSGTVDVDPSEGEFYLSSNGGHDVFVLKLDNSGNFVWARSVGGNTVDRAYGIQADTEGNVTIAGSFEDLVDFDPEEGEYNLLNSFNSYNGFILKLNGSGAFVWAKQIECASDIDIFDLALTSDHSLVITGRLWGEESPTDFDPSEGVFNLYGSSGAVDVFIAKYNSLGELEFAKNFGSVSADGGFSVVVDDDDNIYTSGLFTMNVDFDPGYDVFYMEGGGFPNGDAFIHKMIPCEASYSNLSATACNSYYWSLTDETYIESGSYATRLDNTAGCDSIITLDLTINNSIFLGETVEACESYTWPVNGLSYTSSTTAFADVSPAVSGCDSIMILYLSINNTSSSSNVTTCESYTWPLTGETYSETGSYTHVGTNDNNCEETTTLNLTINNASASSETVSACGSYTWSVNETNYTESGIYTETLSNLAGCDSVVSLHLTVNTSTSGTESITACDSYEWTANGSVYTSSGTYTTTLPNAAGCDSLASLNLTIENSTASSAAVTACDAYLWPVNGTSYTESGTYTSTLNNAAGCDSLVTLELTINTVNTEVSAVGSPILLASASNATYQWLDCNNDLAPIAGATEQIYTATANGDYAVSITSNGCTSISECVAVRNLSVFEHENIGGILLYPNPTSSSIEVVSSHDGISEISIYDISGKEVMYQAFEQVNELSISLDQLDAGIYFASIKTESGVYLEQLVKY